jgi:hypothetical protein
VSEPGLIWVTGTNQATGRVFIATNDGNRIDLDVDMLPAICVALSELYPSNDPEKMGPFTDEEENIWAERSHVASEWAS